MTADPTNAIPYVGEELELFREALNWKAYWSSKLRPHVRGIVGEVGAGIGGSTAALMHEAASQWHFIEPDPAMAAYLSANPPPCAQHLPTHVHAAPLASLPAEQRFDTLIYLDVLEHIEDDQAEVRRAMDRLNPGGKLLALSPAHPWLFSAFDTAVGHYRRYRLHEFTALSAGLGNVIASGHLDAPGTLLSMANRLLLKQSTPKLSQIHTWDRWIIPIARWFDPLVGHSFGRSVFTVTQKPLHG